MQTFDQSASAVHSSCLLPDTSVDDADSNRVYNFTKLSEIADYHQQKALHNRHDLIYLVNSCLNII